MHASLAQNSEKQTAKIHSPASLLSLAGSRPCTFYTKHTQNAKNQLSRPPEWVWPAAAGHIISIYAENQINFKFIDTRGWEGWVGLFGLFPTYRRSPYRCRSLPSFLPCFSTHHYQHVSGSSGVHLSLFRPILKFESF